MAATRLEYGQFQLGPYTIQYRPLRDNPTYIRYAILVEGVEVGAQISTPDLDNCWRAYQDAVSNRRLTRDQVTAFNHHAAEVARKAPTEFIRFRSKTTSGGQSNIGI